MPHLHTPPGALDVAVAALAARQHGVVTGAQLRRLGLGTRAQRQRVAAGRLHRCAPGVYAVGHPILTVAGRRIAAVLACGAGAVLSHRSAAVAWGLLAGDGARIDVTTPGLRSRAPTHVRVHRTRRLPPGHVTTRDGVATTTLARTVVDLGEDATPAGRRALRRAIHEADVLRLLDVAAVERVLAELPGRCGATRIRRALAHQAPERHHRSELEHRFAELVDRHGLPRPRANVHVDAGDRLVEVDALWPDQRVIVELDGQRVHGTAAAFHRDRARDAALAARGYVVVRLTWRRVTGEPAAVAGELRAILSRRPAPCPPAPRP